MLGWVVFQTLKTDPSDSAYNMHPSNFKKPDLEHRLEIKDPSQESDQILDLMDLSGNEKEEPEA